MRKRISSVSAPVAAKREPDTRDLDGPQERTDRGRDGFIEVEARHIAGLGVTVSDSGDAGPAAVMRQITRKPRASRRQFGPLKGETSTRSHFGRSCRNFGPKFGDSGSSDSRTLFLHKERSDEQGAPSFWQPRRGRPNHDE